jgi:protein dithiol:quinone oxidoreductase
MIRINRSRPAWLLLALTALGLELTALYFQYYMQLEPCVLCVYERGSMALVMFAGMLGFINPGIFLLRLGGYLLWAGGVVWGLFLSIKHSAIQMGLISGTASCTFMADFPSWLKLDQWLPWVFNPTGYCEDIQWQFLGLSMPQTMVVINAIYLVVLCLVLVMEFRRS